ncbi:hypothetical protein QM012_000760 [Aureobasidium pullulans]|uniref:UbiA prenyltransferase n=1 Tax=Aureobasidium pullulans TaxID=5580 RepID=A0ABR0TXH4_AURPU
MSDDKPQRDVVRGIYELARLHTREAWLCWYPAIWGACIAAGTQDIELDLVEFGRVLFGIWATVTITHCAFCTFNDLCDSELDKHVERCKVRPIPAGMITRAEAAAAFIVWVPINLIATWFLLGKNGVISFTPIWILSLIYPFMKRVIPFPQVVLGAIIGGAVFPGWVAITKSLDGLAAALPLFAATATWVVYFDVFYATQDSPDDRAIGVKSLAVLMGKHVWILLSGLGVLQIALLGVTAAHADLSPVFWVFGVGVWTLSVPRHIVSFDIGDRKSGGRIFRANIKLGLYLTGVSLAELLFMRVQLNNLPFRQQIPLPLV